MRADNLAERFGISKSTAGNKSGEIRKLMGIGVFEPEWTLPSRLGDNPLVWMFEAPNGFIFDARHAPLEIQEMLFEAGKIPYIPAEKKSAVLSTEEKRVVLKPLGLTASRKSRNKGNKQFWRDKSHLTMN